MECPSETITSNNKPVTDQKDYTMLIDYTSFHEMEMDLIGQIADLLVVNGLPPLQQEMTLKEIVSDISDMIDNDDDISKETKSLWKASFITAAIRLKTEESE